LYQSVTNNFDGRRKFEICGFAAAKQRPPRKRSGREVLCMARTVGIGIQDFGKIIERNCFYVDKTPFLKEWWESEDEVTLITRPRRFGKTLAMSMTEQFFSIKYAGRGSLFEGLSIWQEEKYRALQGTYPVISLSFASLKEINYDNARRKLCQLIASEYNRNSFLLEGDLLTEAEKEVFRRKNIDMDDVD